MKVAIAQSAARSGTGTQDFTDASAGFSSDVKAAVFIACNATTNHSATDDMRLQFSIAANNGGSAAISHVHDDNASALAYYGRYANDLSTNQDAYNYATVGGGSEAEFDIDSWLSNGVRVNWVADASTVGELISCLLIGGDVEASVVHATFAAGTSASAAHGLSGAPEVIIFLTGTTNSTAGNSSCFGIGFWAASAVAGSGFAGSYSSGALFGLNLSTSYVAMEVSPVTGAILSSSAIGGVSVSTVDSDSVDITATVANSDIVSMLCLRGTSTAISAKTGIYDTPTGTGTAAMSLSLGAAPQALVAIPTRMTATGASATDAAGCYGVIAAVNNAGAGTQYGGAVGQADVGSVPTNTASQSTNSQAIRVLDTSHAADVEATVNAWQAADVQLNFSNVNASAFKIPYLAFGISAATKHLKLLTHPGAASATGISGVVWESSAGLAGAEIGEFTGQAFEAATEGTGDAERAVLLVPVEDFGGGSLTTSSTPKAYAKSSTHQTGLVDCTVVEVSA